MELKYQVSRLVNHRTAHPTATRDHASSFPVDGYYGAADRTFARMPSLRALTSMFEADPQVVSQRTPIFEPGLSIALARHFFPAPVLLM